MDESELDDSYALAEIKIALGKELVTKLNSYKSVAGVQKIQRQINREVNFLIKAIGSETLTVHHVKCSNLTHYEFLVKVLTRQVDIIHVDCGFKVKNRTNPVRVDIVCENGAAWIKVVARNAKSISDAIKGRTGFGTKSIVDQAEEYITAATQNHCMFKCPKVKFYFSHEIDEDTLNVIQNLGVEPITEFSYHCAHDYEFITRPQIYNLDITTMLAYVSGLTNGSHNWIFRERLLTDQADRERNEPLKPILDELFKDSRLVCCETALRSFQDIIGMLAGPEEKKRAQSLVDNIEVLADIEEIPRELNCLSVGGKIKPRSLKIFALGVMMEAVTVTSNDGFIRSARMKGIHVPVFIHQARALTESKEATALPVNI